ncbi:hypothetical protein [Marinobacterium jannaschii]|uniref:hypothetical protein n=1 Tax=Marinobacterium jannaschii TaxID=64970 RepID=UPI0004824AFD|nr:hypothetical protein [Marinobacterium jannaschii]
MLKIFANSRSAKLYQAIRTGDLDKLSKLLPKFDREQLSQRLQEQQSPLEVAIRSQQARALELLLQKKPPTDQPCSSGESLPLLALQQQDASLALLSTLLQGGIEADSAALAAACFAHCDESQLMLHLSRLIQHDPALIENPQLMHQGLASGSQPLVHFLINSGALLPDDLDEAAYDTQLLHYARKCAEDRKIRQMFLGG